MRGTASRRQGVYSVLEEALLPGLSRRLRDREPGLRTGTVVRGPNRGQGHRRLGRVGHVCWWLCSPSCHHTAAQARYMDRDHIRHVFSREYRRTRDWRCPDRGSIVPRPPSIYHSTRPQACVKRTQLTILWFQAFHLEMVFLYQLAHWSLRCWGIHAVCAYQNN